MRRQRRAQEIGAVVSIGQARHVAESVLADVLPRRWSHVQGVGRQAESIAEITTGDTRLVIVAAAWLHDVGYAPKIAGTKFHALDGARWLRDQGFDTRICNLVAYHSCAIREAAEYGLVDALTSEFEDEESAVKDALWYCDMTTGPDGQTMSFEERIAEILVRYGPDHPVTRFWADAKPIVGEAVARTEARLAALGQPM